jgi:hypothetical protein
MSSTEGAAEESIGREVCRFRYGVETEGDETFSVVLGGKSGHTMGGMICAIVRGV